MGALKANTRMSTKGQVILPKAVRDSTGWKAGEELVVERTAEGVTITPKPPGNPHFKPTRLEDVFGMLHRPGMKPITLEEMEEAVLDEAAEQYRRSFDAGD